jgi:hypothetical protein
MMNCCAPLKTFRFPVSSCFLLPPRAAYALAVSQGEEKVVGF